LGTDSTHWRYGTRGRTSSTIWVAVEAEFYYYELAMTMNDPATDQNLRIYLSDDDFPAEGNGGHHQGDITLVSDAGVELGWATGCASWDGAGAQPSRDGIDGAGGVDPETGHSRGMYGDTELWNQTDFMQGADQDIFFLSAPIDLDISGRPGS